MNEQIEKIEVHILKSALQRFRQRTQVEVRLLLLTAGTLTVAAIVEVIAAVVKKDIGFSVLGSGGIFGLLTFSRSVYERSIACEFDCDMLEVQLALGGFPAFQKAVVKVSCNKLTNLKVPGTQKVKEKP
ncbi:MAG TPA: hypothetical protein VGJ33_06330 [Candidatus Angelobacter sp.]